MAAGFFTAGFVAADFFAAAFVAGVLAAGFFAAGLAAVVFFAAGFFTAGFFAGAVADLEGEAVEVFLADTEEEESFEVEAGEDAGASAPRPTSRFRTPPSPPERLGGVDSRDDATAHLLHISGQ